MVTKIIVFLYVWFTPSDLPKNVDGCSLYPKQNHASEWIGVCESTSAAKELIAAQSPRWHYQMFSTEFLGGCK